MTAKENKAFELLVNTWTNKFISLEASIISNQNRITETEKTIIKELNNGVRSEIKTLAFTFDKFIEEYENGKKRAQDEAKWVRETKLKEEELFMQDKADKRKNRRLILVPVFIALITSGFAFFESSGIINVIPNHTIEQIEDSNG